MHLEGNVKRGDLLQQMNRHEEAKLEYTALGAVNFGILPVEAEVVTKLKEVYRKHILHLIKLAGI